jgi:hypothetical protein
VFVNAAGSGFAGSTRAASITPPGRAGAFT